MRNLTTQRGSSSVAIVAIIAIVVLVILGIYFFAIRPKNTTPATGADVNVQLPTSNTTNGY